MKILQLCKKFPYPVKDGETLAIYALSKSLVNAGEEVRLLAMNTRRHYYHTGRYPAKPEALRHYRDVQFVEVDNRIKPLSAFFNLFSRESYHIARFRSEAYARALAACLQETDFDVVHLETPYLAPYIPVIRKYSQAAVVMRAHNVESEIWDRVTKNLPSGPKRWYLGYLSRKLRHFETAMLSQYDLLAAITPRDLDQFRAMGFKGKGIVLPVGLDLSEYPLDPGSFRRPLSLGFIGSLDWAPNLEGLEWFLKAVWPGVNREFSELSLHVAGRSTPSWLKDLKIPGLRVLGEVPDAKAFMQQHSILLAPLLSGGGIRVKILEGMALGKVVLSTRMGMEGIPAADRREALFADTPQAFQEQLRFALQHPVELSDIGARARALMASEFGQQALAERLIRAYRDVLPR